MVLKAILTCDIVNSTKISAAKEKKLKAVLSEVLADCKVEFYRGDSFQVLVDTPEDALQLALLCRVAAINLYKDNKIQIADVRISIGVGTVKTPIKTLSTAKGEAFILSGRMFDTIAKTNQRIAISTNNEMANEGLQVISDFLNFIFEKITGKQAEVLFELLNNQTQIAIAQKTGKTKSTIHQLTTAVHWVQIEKILQYYSNIIKLIM